MMLNSIESRQDFFLDVNHSLYQEIEQLRRENKTLKQWIENLINFPSISLNIEPPDPEWEIEQSEITINLVSDKIFDQIGGELSAQIPTDNPGSSWETFINFSNCCSPEYSLKTFRPRASERLHRQILALEHLICQNNRNPDNLGDIIRQITETAVETLDTVKHISLWLHPPAQLPGLKFPYHLLRKHLQCEEDGLFFFNLSDVHSQNSPNLLDIPITLGEQKIGFLRVERTNVTAKWTDEEQSFLESLANLVGGLLERFGSKHLEKQLLSENNKLKTQLDRQTAQLQKTRQKLRSQTAELQKLQFDLQEAQNTAQTALRAKRSFLANISHELRTPIHAIIGYSDLLCEESLQQGHANWLEDVQIIRQQGYRLLRVIDSILDLVRIESGQISLNPEIFDPVHVVQAAIKSLVPIAEKNRNQLKVHYGRNLGLMHTDLGKLQKILHHLLENALKFTKEGQIQLTVRRQGDWIEFCLTDTGIGISTEHQHCLFEAFTQADDSLCRRYGGTGLGLTICRHLCQMMGGDIAVSSQLDRGSTFTVRLKAEVEETIRSRAG